MVLGALFALLQVASAFDKTAEEMLEEISEFSQSDGHGSLVALAIMSHGNTLGDIVGYLQETTCTVQQAVETFCLPHLESACKVNVTANWYVQSLHMLNSSIWQSKFTSFY